jgi:hypothetical protein
MTDGERGHLDAEDLEQTELPAAWQHGPSQTSVGEQGPRLECDPGHEQERIDFGDQMSDLSRPGQLRDNQVLDDQC